MYSESESVLLKIGFSLGTAAAGFLLTIAGFSGICSRIKEEVLGFSIIAVSAGVLFILVQKVLSEDGGKKKSVAFSDPKRPVVVTVEEVDDSYLIVVPKGLLKVTGLDARSHFDLFSGTGIIMDTSRSQLRSSLSAADTVDSTNTKLYVSEDDLTEGEETDFTGHWIPPDLLDSIVEDDTSIDLGSKTHAAVNAVLS